MWTDAGLHERLREIPGVEDVVPTAEGALWLVCTPDARRTAVEPAARTALADAGVAAVPIECVIRASTLQRERVRFDRIERVEERDNQIHIKVCLEWGGAIHEGSATGERGLAIEIRTAATATIAALEKALGSSLDVRLIGVKQVRAFDAELIVVSVTRNTDRQKLVGIVVMGEDPRRAAALAVLNALNRTLGNLLLRT